MNKFLINLLIANCLLYSCKIRFIESTETVKPQSNSLKSDSLVFIQIKQFQKLDFSSHVCKNGIDENYQIVILDSISDNTFDSKKDIVIFISSCRLFDEYRNYFLSNSKNYQINETIQQNCNRDSCKLNFKKYVFPNSISGITYFNESFLIIKANLSYIKGKLSCVKVNNKIENVYFITPFCE